MRILSPTMTRAGSLPPLLLVVLAFALVCVPQAAAQFETPNRAFHNRTSFPLDGRHRDLACESCHPQGSYRGTPTRCFDCHWTRRQDDRYRLQLGTQCEQCHRPTSWAAVRWDHTLTGMALSAAHRTLSCQACHQPGNFNTVAATCFACHRQDYDATRAPNHAAVGFPTTCEACHVPSHTSFRQATFAHVTFPLLGVHALQTCTACHRSTAYAGTPRTCVGCHRTDYDRTTAPNHAATGFSTDCQACHRPTDGSWQRGSFNHRFPISSGPHRQSCTTCHQGGGTFQVFTCVVCHEHSRARMDDKHKERTGYRYDSLACYGCHPTGRH